MTQGSSSLLRESWRPVYGFSGCYEVSDLGNVRSLSRTILRRDKRKHSYPSKILKIKRSGTGYFSVQLCLLGRRYERLVHRLVLEAFVGPCPEGMECRHLNGDSGDNRLENLCWGTPIENAADQRRHGTKSRGEAHNQAKLSDVCVQRIRDAKGKQSTRELGVQYGISSSTVSRIQSGKRRGWRQP